MGTQHTNRIKTCHKCTSVVVTAESDPPMCITCRDLYGDQWARRMAWRVIVYMIILLVAMAVILVAATHAVHAAQPQPKPMPAEQAMPLQKGTPAPFTGVLVPLVDVHQLVQCGFDLKECEAKVKAEKDKRKADKVQADSLLRLANERADGCCKLALNPAPPPRVPWYKRGWFYATVTGLVTATIAVGVTMLVYELK